MVLCEGDHLGGEPVFSCRELPRGETAPEWIELFPPGPEITAVDGRKFLLSSPADLIAAFAADPIPIPLDYEHATEIKAPEGERAPAAGWIEELEERDGGAVWARIDWTPAGAEAVKTKEYRFVSPAFHVDKKTREITKLVSAGLTNTPALRMTALAQRQPTTVQTLIFSKDRYETAALAKNWAREHKYRADKVDETSESWRLRQKEPGDFKEGSFRTIELTEGVKAVIGKLKTESTKMDPEKRKDLCLALGLPETATDAEIATAAMKRDADHKTEIEKARKESPSLANFVPRADYDAQLARVKELETEKAKDEKDALEKEVDAEIAKAMEAGKITPATKDYHRAQCLTEGGLERFRAYVEAAPKVVPGETDLKDKKPGDGKKDEHGLTVDERTVAERCGLTPKEYATGKVA